MQYFLTVQDTRESLKKNNQWRGFSSILWTKKDIPAKKKKKSFYDWFAFESLTE